MTYTLEDLTRDQKETRRLQAARDLQDGAMPSDVARKYGVSRTAVYRWVKALQAGHNLKRTKATGRPRKLTPDQLAEIKRLCISGPPTQGFGWTGTRVAKMIQERYGVKYNPDHVLRILYRLGIRKPKFQLRRLKQ